MSPEVIGDLLARVPLFANLPPGNYRFRLIAANAGGAWSRGDAGVSFAIPPTFFQSYWFVALCVILTLLLFWLAYMLTDQVVEVYKRIEQYQQLAVVVILSVVAGAILYRFLFTKKVSTGEPPPPIIAKPAEAVVHAVEKAVEKVAHVVHPHHDKPPESASGGEAIPAEPPKTAPPDPRHVTAGPGAASSPPPTAS